MAILEFDLLCDLMTWSMTSWKWIYMNIIIIPWYLYTRSLMMISLLVFFSYHEKCSYFIYKGIYLLIFQNLLIGRHFEVATNFFIGRNNGSRIYHQDSHDHFHYFELLIDQRSRCHIDGDVAVSKFDLLCDLRMSSVMSWVYDTLASHRQLCACKILFVWHQSFIVVSSGQTSWQTDTDTHTNKQAHMVKTLSPSYRGW